MAPVRISAKADYAVRAVIELAGGHARRRPTRARQIADAQEIPLRFLENILGELRHAGLVQSRRGAEGGYWLSRRPDEITLADDHPRGRGPAGQRPRRAARGAQLPGDAEPLQERLDGAAREHARRARAVTLADVVAGELPERSAASSRPGG